MNSHINHYYISECDLAVIPLEHTMQLYLFSYNLPHYIDMPFAENNRWKVICTSLQTFRCGFDVSRIIRTYINGHYCKNFETWNKYYEYYCNRQRVDNILKKMIEITMLLPVLCPFIPVLKQYENKSITLSDKQVLCILCNAFFSTFNFVTPAYLSNINFITLFHRANTNIGRIIKFSKLDCLFLYFEEMCFRFKTDKIKLITYQRQHLNNLPNWQNSEKKICNLTLTSYKGCSYAYKLSQVIFGPITSSLEEWIFGNSANLNNIFFIRIPELLLILLFNEKLGHNESLIITGCEKFSCYSYAQQRRSFRFIDKSIMNRSTCRLSTQYIYLDVEHQLYNNFTINLNKIYNGFAIPVSGHKPGIITSYWENLNLFDNQLKCLIQLIAASEAERSLVYSISDPDTKILYKLIKNQTVSKVYNLLKNYCETKYKPQLLTYFKNIC